MRGIVTEVLAYFLYSSDKTMDVRVWWASVIGLSLYALWFVVLPRIRDIGMSGWWLLTTLVPGVNIVFGIILAFRAPAMLSNSVRGK